VNAPRSEPPQDPASVDSLFQAHRIRDCVLRGARGADRLDMTLMGSAFWADATIRFGAWPAWSWAELLTAWAPVAAACASTQHHLFNDRLDLDGDTALLETYYIAVFAPAGDADGGTLLPFSGAVEAGEVAFQGGRYVDRVVRRGDEWRIAARQVCGDWFATADAAQPTALRRSPTDHPGGSGRAGALASTSEHLAELLAVDAIRDCVFRYARGVDRLDIELLESVFVRLQDDAGLVDSVLHGGAARPTQSTYVTSLDVDLDGASAAAEAYFISVRRDAGAQVELIGGRYVFELTAEPGDWRIAKRAVLREWHAIGDGRHLDAFVHATGDKSRRSREDASYHPPLTVRSSRTVADLVQREGVRDCLARYARGVDRLDRELVESSFAGAAPDFIEPIFAQAEARRVQNHYWTNLRVDLTGDVALVEAYYLTVLGFAEGAGDGFGIAAEGDLNLVGGRYLIPFAKADNGQWGITVRGNIGDWHAKVDGSGLAAYLDATDNGGRPRGSREDPSYVCSQESSC
jgi:hypothetical protein